MKKRWRHPITGFCTECDKLATANVVYNPTTLVRVTQETTRLLMPVGICAHHDKGGERMNHRNARVTRRSDDAFEVVIPAGTGLPAHRFTLDHIEAHMLYVKLAIAFGYTTEAVEAATDDDG